ncbi:MAG: DNA methyltransferase [Candidatus Omnitrophota bacterium]
MCRLTLVDHLANRLDEKKNKSIRTVLYDWIFALEPEDKKDADRQVSERKLWSELSRHLKDLSILDPACGSGSFLVGMLHILDDLQERCHRRLEIKESAYERKKRIIGQNLYGVDVMDWACHVAELRLWLTLIVDPDLTLEKLPKDKPLLPHFSFKIRSGNSLVQEVGGIEFSRIHSAIEISPQTKNRIQDLREQKLKFFYNDPNCRYHNPKDVNREEFTLFQEILYDLQKAGNISLQRIEKSLSLSSTDLFGGKISGIVPEAMARLKKESESIKDSLRQIGQSLDRLKGVKNIPFIWDIAFVEIFAGEKQGFDIVIGNPPYVRQEKISDPAMTRESATPENRKAYKEKLIQSVYSMYPRFFGYDDKRNKPKHKLDAKSDLYIYFYFHGLNLLNANGSFCFITSNSWLDVGYGKDLQEFLLKNCQVKLIIDNQAKRSFKEADVNTVISLFSSPHDDSESNQSHLARFVMFKLPFEQILSPVIFQEVEETKERIVKPEYRVCLIPQKILLEEGYGVVEDEDGETSLNTSAYSGNKWGGKYLRAPDIYWTILEKGKGKLVRLGDVAEVRFGIKTGANEFFYLDAEKIEEWGIEEEFLKPVIVSPRECLSIEVKCNELKYQAFVCHKDKYKLKGTNALKYIQWGENNEFHIRPSCNSRKIWYEFPEKKWAKVLWPMIHNNRQNVFWNPNNIAVDHNLFEIYGFDDDILWGSLSWTGQLIFRELFGRSNLGQGALKTEGIDIKKLYTLRLRDISIISSFQSVRKKLSNRPINNVAVESNLEDRRDLDNILFDVLGLTSGERDAVYEAVINLVENRLKKAESV